MWREVERIYQEMHATGPNGQRLYTRNKYTDSTLRELKKGDTVFIGRFMMDQVSCRVTILDNDRARVMADNYGLLIDVGDTANGQVVPALPVQLNRVVEKHSVTVNLGLAKKETIVEWYPEPEEPPVQEVQASLVDTQSPTITVPQLRGDSLPPEAGQVIAERQKYPTLPQWAQVTPSTPEGQDPRPREYYTGSRGSTPPLPGSIRTTRSPWDHRPADYHTGGPGPAGLPPWAQPPKGPIGR